MPKQDSPLFVVVQHGGCTVYGAPSFKTRFLYEFLKRLGVSDSVPPGTYTFDIKRRGLTLHPELLPVPAPPV